MPSKILHPQLLTISPHGTRTFEYDILGRQNRKTDRNGRKTQCAYDNSDNLILETWMDAAGETVGSLKFDYDARHQLESVTDGSHAYSYSYDDLGRLDEAEYLPAGLSDAVTLAMTYNVASERKSVAAT